jgi:hypothetical protein
LVAIAAFSVASCAEVSTTGGRTPSTGPRTAADDGDPWNLSPADADAIADVALGALRASPWSRSLMTGDLAGEREARRRLFGYDVFTEAERMLVIGIETGGAPRTLTIARGSFDAGRVGAAFAAAAPGAVAEHWRDSPLWQGSGRAVALVTPRTIADGDPDAVRAAIDAAWGIVPDARGGPLGELRRALGADRSPPAVFFALSVTEAMRGRAAGVLDLPAELRRVAGRLDLGADLDVEALALFDDGHAAKAAASIWGQAARLYARQRMLVLLGLAPVLDGLTLTAEGSRLHARLHIPADKREGLADKLMALLQLVAGARGGSPP